MFLAFCFLLLLFFFFLFPPRLSCIGYQILHRVIIFNWASINKVQFSSVPYVITQRLPVTASSYRVDRIHRHAIVKENKIISLVFCMQFDDCMPSYQRCTQTVVPESTTAGVSMFQPEPDPES